jgi:tetratricopeptide (TPR) repeat protein
LNFRNVSLAASVDRAYVALQAGRLQDAENLSREVLAVAPDHTGALSALAVTLLVQSRHGEAAAPLEQLVRLEPNEPSHWNNLGTVQRALGRFDEALLSYQRAATLGAQGPDYAFNLGVLQLDRGDFEAARTALREAHLARPLDAEIACQFGTACCETLDTQAGLAALANWPQLQGLTSELIAQIGGVLLSLGDMTRAEQAIQRALEDRAIPPKGLLQAILALERMNRTEQASALLKQLASESVDQLGADLLLARARVAQRERRHAEATQTYERLLGMTPQPEKRYLHLYPLAQSLDALGNYDEAFMTATAAHESQDLWIQRTAPEMVKRTPGEMRITQVGCNATDVSRWDHSGAPAYEDSPVFIVAFPRSGTTLLEQTLDAHPLLVSMDEQPYLQSAVERLETPDTEYPNRLASLTQMQLEAAREHYWSLVRQRVSLGPGQRLIDKNPLNILRLPAITRLFPNARIILAIRHPLDVLLSCFMQHFRPDFAWHCRDIATLGLTYRHAMEFWHAQSSLLAPRVMEIRYESSVTSFENKARDLAAFLGVPWTDAMLAPGEHARRKGFISTPSYSQVVQPVHSRSVNRWQSYARHMTPALAEVRSWVERWGYSVDAENGSFDS